MSFEGQIKQWVQLDNQLKQINEKTKELREVRGKPSQPDGAINVEKAVFVGTTADLLKQIKEQKQ